MKKHILITGHTGFLGSWMSLLAKEQGFLVSGISNLEQGMFLQTGLTKIFENDLRKDITDFQSLKTAIRQIQPDLIVHLAAKRVVRESYLKPRETFEVNAIGTVNLFESVRELMNENAIQPPQAILVSSTDKVYRNLGEVPATGFVETDPIGAQDPMSTSKACADLVAASYSYSPEFLVPIAIARSANLIGAGDAGKDVLLVDIIQCLKNEKPVELRMPNALRPWQSVFDSANGHLILLEKLANGEIKSGEAFNFGADLENVKMVKEITELVVDEWKKRSQKPASWIDASQNQNSMREESKLSINCEKARKLLNWENKLSIEKVIEKICEYEFKVDNSDEEAIFELAKKQIHEFLGLN